MSLQKMTQVFNNLDSCSKWSFQLLSGRDVRGEFVYNAHDVTVITPNAITEFMKELADVYTKPKGKLSGYNMVCDYDGSAIENRIYKIDISDELINESYEKLIHAMENPNMQSNALEFPTNSYVLKGIVNVDGTSIPIKLFTLIDPFKVLKHAFTYDGESFKMMPDKFLLLRRYVDVVIIDNAAYLFNMNGEKLFNMERAYRTIRQNKVEVIVCSGIISDEVMFRKYATSGHNPRKFVAFDENRLQKIRDDETFRNRMAEKFGIIQTPNGTFLLANALPLLAFDFTQYFDVIQFVVIFGFLLIFCLLHRRCDSNVCLELAGYRLYKCKLCKESGGKKSAIVLIHRKQLNTNDEISIRKINDELYIGKYKKPENQLW